jgi:hypothetical protein
MSSARGIRTRTSCGLSAVTPASWSRAPPERIPGIGPGTSPRQGDALPLRHIRMEPPAGTDPATSSLPKTRSAIELRRHELAAQDSNLESSGVKAWWVCQFPYRPSEPPPGATPGQPFLQGTPGRWSRGRGALGGIRTRSIWHLEPASLPCWSTSTWSRHPVPTRGHPLYESGAAAVRGGKAARRGFEPRPSALRTRRPAS